jgi:hypothetical protein
MQESIEDIVDRLLRIYRIKSPFDQDIGFRQSIYSSCCSIDDGLEALSRHHNR